MRISDEASEVKNELYHRLSLDYRSPFIWFSSAPLDALDSKTARREEEAKKRNTMGSHPGRKVPMQVLVLSPPRTGTTSMKLALEELLKAPVWHGSLLMSETTYERLLPYKSPI